MKRSLLITSVVGLLTSSCEEPFDLELAVPSELLVESQLRAGSNPIVNVSAVSTLGEVLDANALAGSVIEMRNSDGRSFELDAVKIEDNVAVFTTERTEVVISGLTYNLTIEAPGYSQVRSNTTVPRSASVDLPATALASDPTPDAARSFVTVPIQIGDANAERNFYHVLVWAYDRALTADEEAARVGQPLPFMFTRVLASALNLGNSGCLFSDAEFANGTLNNQLRVPDELLRQMQSPAVRVEVRTVSQDYYNYLEQTNGLGSGKLPAFASNISDDNIANGTGVFGSYTFQGGSITITF